MQNTYKAKQSDLRYRKSDNAGYTLTTKREIAKPEIVHSYRRFVCTIERVFGRKRVGGIAFRNEASPKVIGR